MNHLFASWKNKKSAVFLAPVVTIVAVCIALYILSIRSKSSAPLALDFSDLNQTQIDIKGWRGVKSAATLLRTADAVTKGIFYTLKSYGLVSDRTDSYDGMIAGTDIYARLRTNTSSQPISSTVDKAALRYKNRLWLTNRAGRTILQMFYDDPVNPYNGNGYLAFIKPRHVKDTYRNLFSNTGILEIRMKSEGPYRVMYVSFTGSPWLRKDASFAETGRFKMVERENTYEVTGLVYTHVDGSAGNVTCGSNAGYSFYTVAYISEKKSPFVTTALWGWDDTSISNKMCGLDLFQYGHLNSASGLSCDGRSKNCPDGPPYPPNQDVYRTYSKMDNADQHAFDERAISGLVIPFVDKPTFN